MSCFEILCNLPDEQVPQPYFCPLEPTGRRADMAQRPELSRGSVEFVATPEYIQRPPTPPVWVFVIDVSASAISAGLPQAVINALSKVRCLSSLNIIIKQANVFVVVC